MKKDKLELEPSLILHSDQSAQRIEGPWPGSKWGGIANYHYRAILPGFRDNM